MPVRGVRLRAVRRRGRRPAGDAPADGGDAGHGRWTASRAIQHAAARQRPADGRAPALADDRAAHAQGLDRPEGGRRPADRGHLARAPGAAGRGRRPIRSTCGSSKPGCGATARRSCSTRTAGLLPEIAALAPTRRPAHERQSARQRRRCCCATCACQTSATTPSTCRAPGASVGRGDARARRLPARRHAAERRPAQLPDQSPGRAGLEPARRGAGSDRSCLDGRATARTTITWRRTAG